MKLQVKGRNIDVTDALEAYATEKLARLDRHLDEATQIEIELAVERNPSIAAQHVAEATVWTKGPILRAREASNDMHASIDLLADKLQRQAQRYREKRQRRQQARRGPHRGDQAAAVHLVDDVPLEQPDLDYEIVKTKQFDMKPMTVEEAVLQLDLIGHDFYVFRNAGSEEVNVVYRRRDGRFGLIEPAA